MGLPVIRSGDLFARYTPDQQAEYFRAVSEADADDVYPEHVFGVNHWRRRLEQTGADPWTAAEVFRDKWAQMSAEDRRDFIEGSAVARRYAGGAAQVVADGAFQSRMDAAAAIAKDPNLGLISLDDPVRVAERIVSDWLGTENGGIV